MFNGVTIIEVEPGTVIEHESAKLTVTDEQYVCKDRCFYLTPKMIAELRNHPNVKTQKD